MVPYPYTNPNVRPNHHTKMFAMGQVTLHSYREFPWAFEPLHAGLWAEPCPSAATQLVSHFEPVETWLSPAAHWASG